MVSECVFQGSGWAVWTDCNGEMCESDDDDAADADDDSNGAQH